MTDPYDLFNRWCLDNGYADVIISEDVNSDRLLEAIEAYGRATA